MAPTQLRSSIADLSTGELEDLARQFDPVRWAAERAQITLPKLGSEGGAIDFQDHAFLVDVMRDAHPEVIVIKGAQLGMSTLAMVRAFWFLTEIGGTVIFSFPGQHDITDFTQGRINPLILNSRYLTARVIDVNSAVRSEGSVMGRAFAGKSAVTPRLRWMVTRESAMMLAYHARRPGMPLMYSRPSKLKNTISIRRSSPVSRP